MKALLSLVLTVCFVVQAQSQAVIQATPPNEVEVQKLRDTAYPEYNAQLYLKKFSVSNWAYVLYAGHYLVVMVNLGDRSALTMSLVKEHNRIYSNLKNGVAVTGEEVVGLYTNAWDRLSSKKQDAEAKQTSINAFIADGQNLIASMERTKAALQRISGTGAAVEASRQREIDSLVARIDASDAKRTELQNKLAIGNLVVTATQFQQANDAVKSALEKETDMKTYLAQLEKGRNEYVTSVQAMAPSLPAAVVQMMSADAIEKLDGIISDTTSSVNKFQRKTQKARNSLASLNTREGRERARIEAQVAVEQSTRDGLKNTAAQQREQAILSAANRSDTGADAALQIAILEARIADLNADIELASSSRTRFDTLVANLK